MFPRVEMVLKAAAFLVAFQAAAFAAEPPVVLREAGLEQSEVLLPDGEVIAVYATPDYRSVGVVRSSDDGATWPESPVTGARWAGQTFLDQDGEIQAFFIRYRKEGPGGPNVGHFRDIFHARTLDGRSKWSTPQVIHHGWQGAMLGTAVQTQSGRLVFPMQEWLPNVPKGPPTGNHYTSVLYSDDKGATWTKSPARLVAPVKEGYNGNNYGAIEAVIVPLKDGRLWMLMRSQMGRLYESFSDDGMSWTEATASTFHASTGPPYIMRLPDERLVLFWNNAEMPPRADGQIVYGGRDALHGAISADDGKTWSGFREVYLDPYRHETPPKKGDRGTAYPHASLTADGQAIKLRAGQGEGRRVVIRVDPDWLTEKTRASDFEQGLGDWTAFKSFGPAERAWRDRVQGARVVDDPAGDEGRVLHLAKRDEKPADGALWNFPAGMSGDLNLRVKFPKGFHGAFIRLTDRFFDPTDEQVNDGANFALFVDPLGVLRDPTGLPPEMAGEIGEPTVPLGKWVDLELKWDAASKTCKVYVDGKLETTLEMAHAPLHGVSYVHLCSASKTTDGPGFFVDSARAEVK